MYNRVCIVGGCGSGKSTLSNILSKKFNLPVVHLDGITFEPGWIEIDKVKRDSIIIKKILEDKWIMEGNYSNTLKSRFDRADLIIWLDYSTFSLLKGILKRIIKTFGKERPEIPGCKEHFDFEFLKYAINYNKNKRHIIVDNMVGVPENKILIFKKQKDLNKWILDK